MGPFDVTTPVSERDVIPPLANCATRATDAAGFSRCVRVRFARSVFAHSRVRRVTPEGFFMLLLFDVSDAKQQLEKMRDALL